MKEPRGRFGEVFFGLAEDLVGSVKRRQQDREPRVTIYDPSGFARVVPPSTEGHEGLLESARALVDLLDEPE